MGTGAQKDLRDGRLWGAGAEMFHSFNWYRRKRGEVVGASQMIRVQTVGVARENTWRLSAAKGGGGVRPLDGPSSASDRSSPRRETDEMGPECGERTGRTQGP